MPPFTRNAMKKSLWKLLSVKPLSKITVRDIVDDCGINRNSFYYHFADIPTLVNETVKDQINKIIVQSNMDSMEDCQYKIYQGLLDNKKEILNIYHSVSRETLERYVMKLCEFTAEKYCSEYQGKSKKMIVLFIESQLFGQYIGWMNTNMPSEMLEWNHQLCMMLKRGAEYMIDDK